MLPFGAAYIGTTTRQPMPVRQGRRGSCSASVHVMPSYLQRSALLRHWVTFSPLLLHFAITNPTRDTTVETTHCMTSLRTCTHSRSNSTNSPCFTADVDTVDH
jgi:hypothetical protein